MIIPCVVCGTLICVPEDFNKEDTCCLKCFGMLKRKDIETTAYYRQSGIFMRGEDKHNDKG